MITLAATIYTTCPDCRRPALIRIVKRPNLYHEHLCHLTKTGIPYWTPSCLRDKP